MNPEAGTSEAGTSVTGIILAGGASRRFSDSDKLSLEIGGISLIERVHAVLRVSCSEILVVGGEGASIPNALANARRIPDSRPGRQGPLAGLEAGLAAATNNVSFVAAGDMPFLSPELVEFLCGISRWDGVSAAVPVFGGTAHPLCAAYRRGISHEISAALDGGVRSMKGFLADLGGFVEYVESDLGRFGAPETFLMNVNTPEDLERARRLA